MEIKYSDLKVDSLLRKRFVDVNMYNTAGLSLSAGYNGFVIIPFNSYINSILFANDADITASNGIALSVCNATTDVVHLAAGGNGSIWSACKAIAPSFASGSLDFTANILATITATTSFVSAGSLLHVSMSATANTVPVALTIVLDPDVAS